MDAQPAQPALHSRAKLVMKTIMTFKMFWEQIQGILLMLCGGMTDPVDRLAIAMSVIENVTGPPALHFSLCVMNLSRVDCSHA